MASPVLALTVSIPSPPADPSYISLPRSVSPVARPSSRCERLLRDTLHRDVLKRPGSPQTFDEYWAMRGGAIDPRGNRVSPSSPRPTTLRVQTSPVPLARSPPSSLPPQYETRQHSRSNSVNQPLDFSPRSRPRTAHHATTSPLPLSTSPNMSLLAHEPSSIAKRRLERALSRNDTMSRTLNSHNSSGRASRSSSVTARPPMQGGISAPSPRSLHQLPLEASSFTEPESNSPQSRTNSLESAASSELLQTPPFLPMSQSSAPPSPLFNAVDASKAVRSIEGVVHFSDIEGLGAPFDLDEEVKELDEDRKERRWWALQWWNAGKKVRVVA